MLPLDLFALAHENTDVLALACAKHTGLVVEFAQSVASEGRLSVTMKFVRLHSFLEGGRYLNPWEECSRDAGGDETKATALMEKRQGSWYGRRALFDGSFEHGKKFRYGALHTGGRALVGSKYGPFCAIFGMAAAASWRFIAWLPADSLERYVPDQDTFHRDLLRSEVGAHGSRHHVAAIKHAGDVAAWPRDEWSTRLCCNDCFVEGIVVDDLLPEQVEHFLADRDTWEELLRANAAFLGGRYTEEQESRADQYEKLTTFVMARDKTINWEQV